MRVRLAGLWHHPDFLRLWAGQTISVFGSHVSSLALPLTAVLVLEASPTQLGLLRAVEYVPYLAVGLFAGVWVDRLRRRPILILSDLGRAALLATVPLLAVFAMLRVEHLYLVALATGTLAVFFEVAYQSFLPSLVPREALVEGNSKLAVSHSVGHLAGPGLGGLLVQLLGGPLTLLVDALSFLASALSVVLIRTREPSSAPAATRGSMAGEIGAGLRLVLSHPLLRPLAGATACLNFAESMALAIYLLYATRELGLAPALLGAILTVSGVGGLLGSLLADQTARRFGLGPTLLAGTLLAAGAALAVPLASGPVLVVVALLALGQLLDGISYPLYFVTQVSLRQTLTPDHWQGRVNATMRVIVWGTMPVGALLGGALGEAIGLRLTLVVAALGMLLATLWLLLSPLRTLREQPAMLELPEALAHPAPAGTGSP